MSATSIVRLAIIVYCAFAAFSIWLLWKNAAASDSVKNSVIALTSVFPLLISVLPYISPEVLEKKMTFVLLGDSKTNSVIAGEDLNAYGRIYFPMFTGLAKFPDALKGSFEEIMGSKGLDLIEKGIVESLVAHFLQHWDLIRTEHVAGPTSESSSYTWTDAPKKAVSASELQNRLNHNALIFKNDSIQAYREFSVPPESILGATQKRNKDGREFFKDDYDSKPLRHSHDSDSVKFRYGRTTGHLGNSVTRSSRYE